MVQSLTSHDEIRAAIDVARLRKFLGDNGLDDVHGVRTSLEERRIRLPRISADELID